MHDTVGRSSASQVAPLRSRNTRSSDCIVAVRIEGCGGRLAEQVASFQGLASELSRLHAGLVFLLDTPPDRAFAREIDETIATLEDKVPIARLDGYDGAKFVIGVNGVLAAALELDQDVFLLDAIALPRPGALGEMATVAYLDPMIGVVSPRSDRATICASPIPDTLRSDDLDRNFHAHRAVERHLPRVTYAPTATAFCIFIKRLILAEFGLFDPAAAQANCAEEDFVRRCNQRGYRAVFANRAYVHCLGRDRRDDADEAFLVQRYPEYREILANFYGGAGHFAERVLSGLQPYDGRTRIIFDCRILQPSYNGTFEHMTALLRAFVMECAQDFEIRVLCDAEAFRFHQLDQVAGLRFCVIEEAIREPAAIAFRLSQPTVDSAATLAHCGAVNGALVLDTIAMDCQQLDLADLASLWQSAADDLDILAFNSAFSRDQFERRFRVPSHVVQSVSRCSTDPADYSDGVAAHQGGAGILLVGNHYPHKGIAKMLEALYGIDPTQRITVFGLALDDPGVGASHASGELPKDVVASLYRAADLVLFPSHYEGFGFPIMHALARRVPVIARDTPAAREIKARCPLGDNLHLFASTGAMAAAAASPPAWIEPGESDRASPHSWRAAARGLADMFDEALLRVSYDRARRHQAAALGRAWRGHFEARSAGAEEAAARAFDAERQLASINEEVAGLRAEIAEARCQSRDVARAELHAADAEEQAALAAARALDAQCAAKEAAALQEAAFAELAEVRVHAARGEAIRQVVVEASSRSLDTGQPLVSQAYARWGWLADIVAFGFGPGIDIEAVPQAGRHGRLSLHVRSSTLAPVRVALWRWFRCLPVGGRLRLAMPLELAGDLAPSRFADALCRIAGAALDRVSDRGGRLTLTATNTSPVLVLPADIDHDLAIEAAFLMLLGRTADEDEHRQWGERVDQGASRDDLIAEIAGSDERWFRAAARRPEVD